MLLIHSLYYYSVKTNIMIHISYCQAVTSFKVELNVYIKIFSTDDWSDLVSASFFFIMIYSLCWAISSASWPQNSFIHCSECDITVTGWFTNLCPPYLCFSNAPSANTVSNLFHTFCSWSSGVSTAKSRQEWVNFPEIPSERSHLVRMSL